MAESIGAYAREIGQLIAEQRVLDELRTELRKPVPVVRKAIRQRALATLPRGGGLNKWAAAIQVKAKQEVLGKTVRVKLTGGRNSAGGRSDIRRMDKGNVRHPTFGNRGKGMWHLIVVTPGFFTEPVTESDEWSAAADRALDRALDRIR